MQHSKIALLLTTVLLNIMLWLSYVVLQVSSADFGRLKGASRKYLLYAAASAYICNLAFVGLLLFDKRASPSMTWTATACVAIYYGLQFFFIPTVRASTTRGASRNYVRSLLIACILPVVVLAGIGLELRRPLLSALGIIVVAHVAINDAILYGYQF